MTSSVNIVVVCFLVTCLQQFSKGVLGAKPTGNTTVPQKADVIIVGGGVSGCAAATFLQNSGLSVVLFEKTNELGGLLRGMNSVGATMIPRNRSIIMDELPTQILTEDPNQSFTMEELDAMFNDGNAAYDTLLDLKGVDDFEFFPESTAYYGDSRSLHYHLPDRDLFEQLYASAITLSLYFLGPAGQNLIEGVTPLGDDGKVLIPGTVRRLTQTTQDLQSVNIFLNTQVTSLQESNDQTDYRWSVQGLDKLGMSFEIAGKHVIFASGGFTANREFMMKRGLEQLTPHYWNNINTGVVEEVAEELGFRACPKEQRDVFPVWFAEAIELPKGKTQAVLFLSGDSMMVVNRKGVRVYNEKWPYARRGRVCLEEGWLILIMDGRNLKLRTQSSGLQPAEQSVFFPSATSGGYIHATTTAALYSKLAALSVVDPEFETAIDATLRRFKRFADSGIDEDFGRHDYPRNYEPTSYPPMSPIDPTDLYALVLRPSALDTCSGPFTNVANSQVQYENGIEVPGVYAIGNAACSITHGFYMGPGFPSFSGTTQAYRAAKDIQESMENP